jgi:16S rRNA (cytidine1402-2'-O)-methyltransferase
METRVQDDDLSEAGKAGSFQIRTLEIPARPIEPGLYLVATPIGNLSDITLRALETLAAADILAAEDTRTTRILLDRYGISRRTFAYHEHNADAAGARLLDKLIEGKSVAIVSDAGTPLVSDPGYRLVRMAIDAGIRVIPIPGPSSVITALCASGLPSDAFFFGGFLPHKQKARRDRLSELEDIPGTLLFLESPHRIGDALADGAEMLGGDRQAAVCREMTKTFEEFRRGSLAELAAHYSANPSVKGEIVFAIAPPGEKAALEGAELDQLLNKLAVDMPTAKAAAEAAKQTGLPRKDLYQRLLELKG